MQPLHFSNSYGNTLRSNIDRTAKNFFLNIFPDSVMDDSVAETQVKILFFAKARELTGKRECYVKVPREILYTDLINRLIKQFQLESIRDIVILAVNEEYVSSNITLTLTEKDEIAVIPPLSGAPKDMVKLQHEELNIGDIIESVTAPNCGAISNFIGITRDNFDNKKVLKLEYEAYEPMALKEMNNICSRIRSQWNVHHIAVYHRLGEVPVSKASVVIAVSSPHRGESLNAVEYAINALKASVPIWKKEVYDSQEAQWKGNQESDLQEVEHITLSNDLVETVIEYEGGGKEEEEEDSDESNIVIDPNLVQIRATPEELNNRISSFIERKRQQVNIVNVQEFCCHRDENDDNEDSCARVDAILIRRKDSKSHVKVHRVLNAWGPQMVDQHTLRKATLSGKTQGNNYSSVLDERMSTTEKILGISRPVPKDIYERLKNIEDRILYLEGISPEYKEFWKTEDINNLKGTFFKPVRKRTYSMAELDSKLHELEDKYAKKMK